MARNFLAGANRRSAKKRFFCYSLVGLNRDAQAKTERNLHEKKSSRSEHLTIYFFSLDIFGRSCFAMRESKTARISVGAERQPRHDETTKTGRSMRAAGARDHEPFRHESHRLPSWLGGALAHIKNGRLYLSGVSPDFYFPCFFFRSSSIS